MRNSFCLGLMIFLGTSFPFAQSPPGCLTEEDIFDFEFVTDIQVSPDGRQVVYVRNFADIMTDQWRSNIWLLNFDGSAHRPITSGNFNEGQPRWSPDGSQIIFTSNRGGSAQIHKWWKDTGNTAVITNLTHSPSEVTWSRDAKYVAFTAFIPGSPKAIAAMPPEPSGAKWAQPPTIIDRYNGFYRGNGNQQVFIMSQEGGAARRITNDENSYSSLSWTPDGEYIIASSNQRSDAEIQPLDAEVFEIAVKEGSVRKLTDHRGPDASPEVSPDGKHIAFLSFDDKEQGYQATHLYVMERDGSRMRVLTKKLDRKVLSFQWAADSRALYFLFGDKGKTLIGYIPVSGEVVIEVARNAGSGRWGTLSGAFSAAPNGNFAYTFSAPDYPGDISVGSFSPQQLAKTPKQESSLYQQGVSSFQTKLITAINSDILETKKLHQVEEIWYPSSKDARPIHGWIMKPPGFDPLKKYPLILEIHGGPFWNYAHCFDFEKEALASAGYVVLYTNPRGSTSYGEEFGNLIHHAYPGDDYYDLMSGIDAVIEKGYIDKENIFVTGGSGGGVLTCWLIGRSKRFRGAVTLYPVINWTSFVLTADVGDIALRYWFPGFPWDHPDHYESRSVLSVVKNVSCPTMIICGEDDSTTPISESEQYFNALQLLGVESVLVRVPGGQHSLWDRPSLVVSKLRHIIAWFDQHKKRD